MGDSRPLVSAAFNGMIAEAWILGAAGRGDYAPWAEQERALIDGPELQRLGVAERSDAAIYSLEIRRLASPATAS